MKTEAHTARPKPPIEVPLDDGARDGTEEWRVVDGVSFCHWDRWLLRLTLEEPRGLRAIAEEFQCRARRPGRVDNVAEAMLAQVAALEARLTAPGRTPKDVLDDVERASKWLHDKAFRRVWHATSVRHTQAMMCTPRNVLAARAREGNWAAFPVSPAPYFARLHAIYRDGYFDYRGVNSVVLLLQIEGERMLTDAESHDVRLAVRRAIVGAAIDAMKHVDDSGNDLGEHFRDEELAYLELVRPYIELPGVLRDLLELAVWEDYGLFHHLEAFLGGLSEPAADLAIRELARILSELRCADLDYQRGKAHRLRGFVLESVKAGTEGDDPCVTSAPGGTP